jgi:outer membrane protein assembly factor BamB
MALILGIAAVVVIAGAVTYELLRPSSTSSSGTTTVHGLASCPAGGANATAGNWTTYHQNNDRTGVEAEGPIASVTPAWAAPVAVDGQVYAEPLVCGPTVFVATEEDSVYALDATNGSLLWRTHLGTPVPGSSLPCGDINPSGITGTPVIDVGTGTLYVVAFLTPTSHVLFGLNTTDGAIVSQTNVNPPGVSADVEQQRSALTLANGFVYIPFGGLFGDCGQYHGYVLAVSTANTSRVLSYQVPTMREGAIWGTGGASLAANGSLYVATGNGASNSVYDFGDSVIELSPSLTEFDSFAPANWVALNENDQDLGSVGPTVLPNGDVFQIGKEGVGYLLSGTHLGGIDGQLGEAPVCGGGAYGGTAQVGSAILVPCMDGLFDVIANATNVSVAWHTASFFAGSPIVTGNVVWTVNISAAELVGLNLSTGALLYALPIGAADHFISPAAAPGRLFVAGGTDLYAFALA